MLLYYAADNGVLGGGGAADPGDYPAECTVLPVRGRLSRGRAGYHPRQPQHHLQLLYPTHLVFGQRLHEFRVTSASRCQLFPFGTSMTGPCND